MMNKAAKVIPYPAEEQTVIVKRSYLERLENLLLHATWENIQLRRSYNEVITKGHYVAPDGTVTR